MNDDIRRGLSQVYWNREEERFRTPARFGIAVVLLFLFAIPLGIAAFVIGLLVGGLGPFAAAVFETLSLAALTGAVLAVIWYIDRRYFTDIGLSWDRKFQSDLAVGSLVGIAMAVSVALPVLFGAGSLSGMFVTREGDLFAGVSLLSGLLVALAFFLVLAILEELLFRGYILVNVSEGVRGMTDARTAVLAGVGVSSVLFGVAHAANPAASVLSTLNIFLFGLVLGGAYVLTDRLAIPIGIHTTWNFTLGPVLGLPVSGLTSGVALVDLELGDPTILTGGAFGPEGGLIALVALALGACLLYLWVRRTVGRVTIHEEIAQPTLRNNN